ncbi:hypothetical protein VNO80_06778 [Phaseolus coccineus]|uniref:Uncharacterized protein n=1 Tax=Phaseolus coccineus TaxID=3886 RepID=A0AAN9NM93_PHACN
MEVCDGCESIEWQNRCRTYEAGEDNQEVVIQQGLRRLWEVWKRQKRQQDLSFVKLFLAYVGAFLVQGREPRLCGFLSSSWSKCHSFMTPL